MKRYLFSLIAIISLGCLPAYAAPIRIAAAIPDLGSIAAFIGGDRVEVFSIARSNANTHFVEVLPSYMIKVSRAAIYLKTGLYLDQWSDAIIDGSRNNRLLVVDCSKGVPVLEKPDGPVSALQGDVHPGGNPHYWLDPSNGVVVAGSILEALKKADSANADYYEQNFQTFKQETEKRTAAWKEKMAKLAGQKIIGYHSSWVYFARAFDLVMAGYVEPLPGIPPTGRHLAELVDLVRRDRITLLFQERYFPDNAPRFLARQTGIKVFKFSPCCDDVKPDAYFRHFDDLIGRITDPY